MLASLAGLAVAQPAAAADVRSIPVGPRSCTGASFVYTSGNSNGNALHSVTGSGYDFSLEKFVGARVWTSTYYYPGIKGTFNGRVSVVDEYYYAGMRVRSASMSCDV